MNITDDQLKQHDDVSDTPRTETERLGSNIKNQSDSDKEWPWSAIDRGWDFARILERELAAVAAERDVLRGDLCTFAVDMERELSLATATIANQHKLITDAEQRGEKKADEAWIARETQLMAEKDALLAEKANPETTWDDTVEINKLRADLSASQQEARRLREALELYRDALSDAHKDTERLNFCDTMIDLAPGFYVLRFPVTESCTIRDAIDAELAKEGK